MELNQTKQALIKQQPWVLLIWGSPVLLVFISIFLGRYPVPVADIAALLASPFTGREMDPTHFSIIFYVRLPRVLLGALVGGSLAVSGAAFQGLFRNPLVSSGMLGVSSGAGFGAALALVLFKDFFYVYPFSFGFGLAAVALCFFIGRITHSSQALTRENLETFYQVNASVITHPVPGRGRLKHIIPIQTLDNNK
jgi:iron complex transport system permease protein